MTQIVSPSHRRRAQNNARKQWSYVLIGSCAVIGLFLVSFQSNIFRKRSSEDNKNNITGNGVGSGMGVANDLEEFMPIVSARKLRKRRLLPSFENGGVIIFFHIAKTGGASIRNFIQNSNGMNRVVHVERMWNPETAVALEHEVHVELTKKNSSNDEILFVEIYGDVPGFVYWQKKLHAYRELANYKSFFSFTVVREPISFHTSYFNTYKLAPCTDDCETPLYEAPVSESILLETAIPNHQCLWLSRLSHNPYRQESCVTDEECRGTYNFMKDHLDWIGTTEELNTVTFPLLSHLVSRKKGLDTVQSSTSATVDYPSENVASKKDGQFNTNDLSDDTKRLLLQRSAGDVDVYSFVKRDYNIKNYWENYAPLTQKGASALRVS